MTMRADSERNMMIKQGVMDHSRYVMRHFILNIGLTFICANRYLDNDDLCKFAKRKPL